MGTLYLVGTPIGNLGDLSERTMDILSQVSLIASENPQRTRRLLSRYSIQTPMTRYTDAYDRKKESRRAAVLRALEEGDVALVSEAGMPGLADPGYELLQIVMEQGMSIVPVSGPTALEAALSVAGIPCERFVFLGFLPRRGSKRRELLASMVDSPFALVAYEAPHRLLGTLADLESFFGQRPVAAANELTKLYEEVRRGTAGELLEHYRQHQPRGEFTLVIGELDKEADQHEAAGAAPDVPSSTPSTSKGAGTA
jgi:16S rRNA (cytidine1402-2'-O)-methyltransferase